jgi:hypothetical protein
MCSEIKLLQVAKESLIVSIKTQIRLKILTRVRLKLGKNISK